MGIPRIMPLIERNPSLFKTYILRKCSLVIDGSCLEHCLYKFIRVNKHCGGDYDVYATKVERFFIALQKLQIDPFVVFDGGHELNDRKVANQMTRAQNRINDQMKIAPILIHETFVSSINKMSIKHVTCDFDAGHEMLDLANNLNCPLLSKDSDFFIFKLVIGYISISDINLRLLTSDAEITKLHVKMFHVRNLFAKFPYLEGKLALLASAFKTDYVTKESDAVQKFYSDLRVPKPDRDIFEIDNGYFCVLIRKVLYWLENCRNLDTGKNHLMKHMSPSERRALETFMLTYKNSYKYAMFDLCDFMRGSVQEEKGKLVIQTSTWIVHNHRLGKLPNFVQNTVLNRLNILLCQVEDMNSESSHACSKPIRQVIYGILLGNQENVQEVDRFGDKPVESTVQGVNVSVGIGAIIPNRINVNRMEIEQRLEVLRKTTTAPIPSENVAAFHKSGVLFVMVLVFWLKSSNDNIDSGLTSSLLLCFIILSTLQDETADPEVVMKVKHIEKSLERPPSLPIPTACHPLAQFQSCLKYCIYLNKLLDHPVEDINPALCFRGSLLHKIFHTVQEYGDTWILTQLRSSPILSGFFVDTMEFIRHSL